ncbi:MAG: protein phosphatase 2C domain-containing protein [Zoogloeaceae bacterium]|jgi:serine/threonine protein phosphatase PrpC|nr:protein phosphatase 2C domain-containing protein [Zoogloeaceae bacterium]
MRFTIYQESRRGQRKNNEDRLAYCYSRDALLLVVADGMGGHYYGEVAAQIAVQTLANAFQQEARTMLEDPFWFLQKHINNAHHAISAYSEAHRLKDSPRTTIVACVIQENIAYWAHAGDSRLYLIHQGRIASQTRDHSQVQMLLDEGMISREQAETHPERNKVYSCLGGSHPPEVECSRKTPLHSGDLLVLCTDGLWGVTPGDIMAQSLQHSDLVRAASQMMDRAEEWGGAQGDNLSLITVRWEEDYEERSPSIVSTLSMGPSEFTTRMEEFGRDPGYKSELSDDEIERAIDEIRAAIDKISFRK